MGRCLHTRREAIRPDLGNHRKWEKQSVVEKAFQKWSEEERNLDMKAPLKSTRRMDNQAWWIWVEEMWWPLRKWLFHWYVEDHEKFVNINFICQFAISPSFLLNNICKSLCQCGQRRAKDLWIKGSTHGLYVFVCNTLLYPETERWEKSTDFV